MTEPADRDGMFTDPRLLVGRNHIDGNFSVVTCTWCGCVVADTEAHERMHRRGMADEGRHD